MLGAIIGDIVGSRFEWHNIKTKEFQFLYSTIGEVLADSTTLLAVISSANAVDYMVRSTTWASSVCANSTAMTYMGANNYCADALLSDSTWRNAICNSTYFESVLNVKVPTMTSATTPSGEVSASDAHASYPAWKAFDGDDTSEWQNNEEASAGQTKTANITYKFVNDTKINKVYMLPDNRSDTLEITNVVLKGSSDGSSFSTIGNLTPSNNNNAVANSNYYKYYRLDRL